MNNVHWSDPNQIIVTGAAGFIGSNLVRSLLASGEKVISVDHPAHFVTRFEHQGQHWGSMVDREQLPDLLQKMKPKLKCIYHLGACTDTTELDEAFLKRVNIEYSKSLWNFCSETQTPLVYASSAATYGDGSLGYDDNEEQISELRALNPYGESKRLFDLWALHQELNQKAPPAWSGFKFFNVYGLGERHKGKMASVILHAFDQIQSRGNVRLFKSHKEGIEHGHQKRDFIWVEDVVKVLRFAGEKPIRRGIFNLGTGQARTFLELVQAVFTEMGQMPKIDFIDTPEDLRPRYQYFTEAKMDKLRAEGFTEAFTSIEKGAARYVEQLLSMTRK